MNQDLPPLQANLTCQLSIGALHCSCAHPHNPCQAVGEMIHMGSNQPGDVNRIYAAINCFLVLRGGLGLLRRFQLALGGLQSCFFISSLLWLFAIFLRTFPAVVRLMLFYFHLYPLSMVMGMP